jgi:hypothetical protein
MGAQATSFCALDTLAVSYLDRIRSSRRQKFRKGQKNFQEASVTIISHWFYWYFSAMRIGSGCCRGITLRGRACVFLGSFGSTLRAATAKGRA